jgi:hypothetical protein
LRKIDPDGSSNKNNKPASAAGSVQSTVLTKFVTIKKSISYLVHHHPKLKVDKNDWISVISEKTDIPSLSERDPHFTKNNLLDIKELNIKSSKVKNGESKVEESEFYEMISNLKTDSLTNCLKLILAIVVIFNLAIFWSRDPVQNMAYKDIQYHILTCDI